MDFYFCRTIHDFLRELVSRLVGFLAPCALRQGFLGVQQPRRASGVSKGGLLLVCFANLACSARFCRGCAPAPSKGRRTVRHHRTKVLVVRDVVLRVARVFVVDVDGLLFVVHPKNGADVPSVVQSSFHHVVKGQQGGGLVSLLSGRGLKHGSVKNNYP